MEHYASGEFFLLSSCFSIANSCMCEWQLEQTVYQAARYGVKVSNYVQCAQFGEQDEIAEVIKQYEHSKMGDRYLRVYGSLMGSLAGVDHKLTGRYLEAWSESSGTIRKDQFLTSRSSSVAGYTSLSLSESDSMVVVPVPGRLSLGRAMSLTCLTHHIHQRYNRYTKRLLQLPKKATALLLCLIR